VNCCFLLNFYCKHLHLPLDTNKLFLLLSVQLTASCSLTYRPTISITFAATVIRRGNGSKITATKESADVVVCECADCTGQIGHGTQSSRYRCSRCNIASKTFRCRRPSWYRTSPATRQATFLLLVTVYTQWRWFFDPQCFLVVVWTWLVSVYNDDNDDYDGDDDVSNMHISIYHKLVASEANAVANKVGSVHSYLVSLIH